MTIRNNATHCNQIQGKPTSLLENSANHSAPQKNRRKIACVSGAFAALSLFLSSSVPATAHAFGLNNKQIGQIRNTLAQSGVALTFDARLNQIRIPEAQLPEAVALLTQMGVEFAVLDSKKLARQLGNAPTSSTLQASSASLPSQISATGNGINISPKQLHILAGSMSVAASG